MATDYDPVAELASQRDRTHFTCTGEVITVGAVFWDNNLDRVVVKRVAAMVDGTPDGPLGVVAWHDTERVSDGRHSISDASRLAKRHPFTGESA